MENLDSPKIEDLKGELFIRGSGFSDKWKACNVIVTGTSIYKAKPGRSEVLKDGSSPSEAKKKLLTEFHWTSTCVEVAPTEFVAFRNDQPRPKIKRDFCFKVSSTIDFSRYGQLIYTNWSTVYFAARDQQERSTWIQAISNKIEQYKKTPQCIEKHNNLVKAMKDRFGANWAVLSELEGSSRTTSDPRSEPLDLNSTMSKFRAALTFNRTVNSVSTPEPPQDSGMTKKELEMKVAAQDIEISQLKSRLEAVERTVADLAKLVPK